MDLIKKEVKVLEDGSRLVVRWRPDKVCAILIRMDGRRIEVCYPPETELSEIVEEIDSNDHF